MTRRDGVEVGRKEIRSKGIHLFKDFLNENRASPLLFITLSTNGAIFIKAISLGLLNAVQTFDAEMARLYLLIVAMLALETGRGPILGPSILSTLLRDAKPELQIILASLMRCIMHEEFGHLAATIMTLLLEHPDLKDLSTTALTELLGDDVDMPMALESRLWELVQESDLMAQFVLFRLHSTGKTLSGPATAAERALSITKKLQVDVAKAGRFPQVYLDLCLLFVLLKEETVAQMAHPRVQSDSGWYFGRREKTSTTDLDTITWALLSLLQGNLDHTRDAFQHDMLAAILTNILIDRGTALSVKTQDSIQRYHSA